MILMEEKDLFESLTKGEYVNFALVEGSFMGRRAVFVASVNLAGEDYLITPLAVLLREQDLGQCLGPQGERLQTPA